MLVQQICTQSDLSLNLQADVVPCSHHAEFSQVYLYGLLAVRLSLRSLMYDTGRSSSYSKYNRRHGRLLYGKIYPIYVSKKRRFLPIDQKEVVPLVSGHFHLIYRSDRITTEGKNLMKLHITFHFHFISIQLHSRLNPFNYTQSLSLSLSYINLPASSSRKNNDNDNDNDNENNNYNWNSHEVRQLGRPTLSSRFQSPDP